VALDCIEAGVDAAHPDRVIHDTCHRDGARLTIADAVIDLDAYDEVVVLGGGKAGAQVAVALDDVLGEWLSEGAVVTNDPEPTTQIDILPGAHPVPDEAGIDSTESVLELAREADEKTLVLATITGGGSALLAAPELPLSDLQAGTTALLESGASIHEINAVRKHLSAIKGGQLARTVAPATLQTLVLSDVVGNDLDVIASGPTVPDSSTFDEALGVLERYDVSVPASVTEYLDAGAAGERPETPGPGDPAFDGCQTHVLADGLTALEAARDRAESHGYESVILSSRIRGEAREEALSHLAIAEEIAASHNPVEAPAVLLSGGETTVTVRGDGTGGPNQEFALRVALDTDGVCGAVDTDGLDGSTDAAGAIVDGDTVGDRETAADALADNDAYGYLDERDAVLRTGATGTNVNDLRVIVVEE